MGGEAAQDGGQDAAAPVVLDVDRAVESGDSPEAALRAVVRAGGHGHGLSGRRSGRKPVDDLKNLRQELLDLQKANRDLKRDLDDLKKKVQATPATSGTKPTRRTTAPKDL